MRDSALRSSSSASIVLAVVVLDIAFDGLTAVVVVLAVVFAALVPAVLAFGVVFLAVVVFAAVFLGFFAVCPQSPGDTA